MILPDERACPQRRFILPCQVGRFSWWRCSFALTVDCSRVKRDEITQRPSWEGFYSLKGSTETCETVSTNNSQQENEENHENHLKHRCIFNTIQGSLVSSLSPLFSLWFLFFFTFVPPPPPPIHIHPFFVKWQCGKILFIALRMLFVPPIPQDYWSYCTNTHTHTRSGAHSFSS